MTRSREKFVVVRGGSGEWLRGGTAGFRGMAQVWSGEELWRIGGYNCPQVRGDTPQRSRWEAPVYGESTGGCSAVSARGGAR